MIDESAVIWITDKAGVVIEEYKGVYSNKAVQKYQSQGAEKVSYDWVKRDTWNKETRTRETPAKANAAMGVSLGDKEQAIASLYRLLKDLGHEKTDPVPKGVDDPDGVPF